MKRVVKILHVCYKFKGNIAEQDELLLACMGKKEQLVSEILLENVKGGNRGSTPSVAHELTSMFLHFQAKHTSFVIICSSLVFISPKLPTTLSLSLFSCIFIYFFLFYSSLH